MPVLILVKYWNAGLTAKTYQYQPIPVSTNKLLQSVQHAWSTSQSWPEHSHQPVYYQPTNLLGYFHATTGYHRPGVAGKSITQQKMEEKPDFVMYSLVWLPGGQWVRLAFKQPVAEGGGHNITLHTVILLHGNTLVSICNSVIITLINRKGS